ncbi:MAG: NERD domain-containing protein [Methanoregula sp.]|nr:NERD domain-containing protein [Methanoregula sp.]
MARIHGTSGSIRLLLNGTKPVHGRRLSTLEDIIGFQNTYLEILAESETAEAKHQEEIIRALEERESELNRQLADEVEQRTRDVYTRILAINEQIDASESFFVILALMIRFWGANQVSSLRIHLPSYGIQWKLWQLRKHKQKAVADKAGAVRSASGDIDATAEFLSKNQSYLVGALAEQQVVSVLSQLPDDFHVMNGVNLHRFDPVYWWRGKDRVRYQQIDPVVIGPTGLFLIGTRNWAGSDIELKTGDFQRQKHLATRALWCYMKDEYRFYERNPKIRCVIVSLRGSHPDLKIDKDIDIVTLDRLPEYITGRESTLSAMNVERLTHVIPFREAQ